MAILSLILRTQFLAPRFVQQCRNPGPANPVNRLLPGPPEFGRNLLRLQPALLPAQGSRFDVAQNGFMGGTAERLWFN